jgi:hypothetical protein
MKEFFEKLPGDLSDITYIIIAIAVIIGAILITRLTGNRSKKINKYSNISQSGMNNQQNIGEKIKNKGKK